MRESLSTLADLFTRSDFQLGVAVGVAALVALAIGSATIRYAPWGLAVAIASLVGLQIADTPSGPVAGVVVLALGGWLVGLRPSADAPIFRWAGIAIVLAGAVLVAVAVPDSSARWIAPATFMTVVIVGVVLTAWGDIAEAAWLGPLFAITTFGGWTTVPDTELARLMLGVTIAAGVATWRPVSARITPSGAFALAGVFAWLPTVGGAPRPASIIGSWACIGVIAVIPLVRPRRGGTGPIATWHLLVAQGLMAVISSRVIGLWTWAIPAVLAAVALFVVAAIVIERIDPVTPDFGGGDR